MPVTLTTGSWNPRGAGIAFSDVDSDWVLRVDSEGHAGALTSAGGEGRADIDDDALYVTGSDGVDVTTVPLPGLIAMMASTDGMLEQLQRGRAAYLAARGAL